MKAEMVAPGSGSTESGGKSCPGGAENRRLRCVLHLEGGGIASEGPDGESDV